MKRMVRYKLKADRVDENERLVRAVYQQLAERRPAGVRERCEEPPVTVEISEIGSYGFFAS